MWHGEIQMPGEHVFSAPNNILLYGRYATGPHTATSGHILVDNSKIKDLFTEENGNSTVLPNRLKIDLEGFLLLPGLINAHDHLQYALHPKLGQPPYDNYVEWAGDIQATMATTISRLKLIPRDVRLWWGGLRNLLAGVTTACHHDALWPTLQNPDFPVKVVSQYGWAHSLAFGGDLVTAFQRSAEDVPFILHACEGTDAFARKEFDHLRHLGVLAQRTVLVHGLALTRDSVELMKDLGASLVLCPSSNLFLYHQSPKQLVADELARVAIGSDSPLTAQGDLLDELEVASNVFSLSEERLYEMVTSEPASILRLQNGEGSLSPGSSADIIAVRDLGRAPANRLRSIHWKDIEFVMIDGQVRLSSSEVMKRLPQDTKDSLEPLEIDGVRRWLQAPLTSLWTKAWEVLGNDVRLGQRLVTLPDAHPPCSIKEDAPLPQRATRNWY